MIQDILVESFDILQFLDSRGFTLRYIGNKTGYLTECPFCGKEDHMGVNPDKHKFACYRCRTAGSVFKLIQKVSGKTFTETVEFLKSGLDDRYHNVNFFDDVLKDLKASESIEAKILPCKLPLEYLPLNAQIPYTLKRKISLEQILYYKMGICREGRYKDRLIVCDVNESQIPIYWIARDLTGKADKGEKVLNPASEYTSLGSADILFNFSLANRYESGIVTEGVFDAIWVGNNGLASYGKGLKQSHTYWIIRGGFKKIVLMYDADVKTEELEQNAIKLAAYCDVHICKLPFGDPDDFDRPKLAKLVEDSPKFIPSKLNVLAGDLNDNH